MGLFKHDRERKRVQKADPPSLEDSSIRTWLRHLGKKHKPTSGRIQTQEECPGNDSASPALDSRPPSNHEGSRTTQSLWDRAYDTLAKDNGPLLKEYEELLMGARMTSSTSNDEPPAQVLSPDDLNRGIGGRSRQAQLEIIIAEGLQRVENKKKQYTIAGYEFSLTDQIARAADFILWAKDLIGEAVKQSPEASIAWAGVSIVLPLLTNPKVADDANRDGFTYVTTRMSYYAELETQIQRLDGDPEVSHALVMEAKNQIVILYRHILEFQIRSVLRFYRSRVSTYIHDVLPTDKWEQMRLEIEKDEGIVNENLRQINEFTSIQKLQSLDRTTRDKLEEVRLLLSVSKEQLRVAEDHLGVAKKTLEIQEHEAKRMLSDRQKACLQLFRLTSSSKDITYEWYKDRIESRVAGTCEWFLKHENFQRWLEQDSGPLLVSADPGCGKSVLAKYLVDEGLPRQTICYFFFKDHDQNTVRQALCALLHQLFKQNLSLLEHATNQFDQDGQGLIDSAKSLWTVFRNAVQDPRAGPLIIVLDALDECDETEFEDLMRNLENQFYSNQSNHSRLKYLLTSRPYEQIVSKFRYLLDTFPHIRIPGEDKSETIGQEVNHVIKHRVDRLAKEKRLPDDTKKHLERKLREIPNRTYLWAYLVFDFLNTEPFKKTPKGVDSTMATLPKNVYQAYEHILSKSKDHSMVRKALSIILAASRPLTITEMNVAMNIDNTSKSIHDLDLEDEINFKERLRTLCGLFVSVHHGKVYFLHQTAREFLLDLSSTTAIPPGLHWQNSITSSAAHMVLAELCVIYLDFLNFDDIPTDESGKTSQDLLHNYTFLDYAANNWGDHFGEACVGDNASILASTLRICDPALKSCSTWFGIYWEAYEGPGAPTRFTSLLIPSYLGHEVTVKLLLRKGANIEARDEEYGRTPLSWAAGSGHVMITKMLLEKGANIESRDEDYGQTPLMLAAMNGHVSVVELLLEKGADIKSIDKKLGRTPLIWAAMNGHVVVVELMLEKGADIECIDKKFGRTPLIWAVEGHVTVVELLLRKNANVESRDEFGRTPLSLAAHWGQAAILKLLLEKGANMESIDNKFGRTPLIWAAWEGQDVIVELLLEKGADLEFRDGVGQTPLSLAAENWNSVMVKLLLEKGAHIESRDNIGQTPLTRAARNGKDWIVELLLEKGADIESKDELGRTPLIRAAESGRHRIVELLLEKGADIESRDISSQTPLSSAAESGRDWIVELLLEKGADTESRNRLGQTPLSLAAEYGNPTVVKLLLEKGADIESRNSVGCTPLSLAAKNGKVMVVKLLLEKGADIESKDEFGLKPLMWAVKNWNNVVRLLLENGAGAKPKHTSGRNPDSWETSCADSYRRKTI